MSVSGIGGGQGGYPTNNESITALQWHQLRTEVDYFLAHPTSSVWHNLQQTFGALFKQTGGKSEHHLALIATACQQFYDNSEKIASLPANDQAGKAALESQNKELTGVIQRYLIEG